MLPLKRLWEGREEFTVISGKYGSELSLVWKFSLEIFFLYSYLCNIWDSEKSWVLVTDFLWIRWECVCMAMHVYTHVFVLVYVHNRYEILLTTASSLFALYPCLSFSSEKQKWKHLELHNSSTQKQKALACCSSYPLPETSHSGS